MESMEKSEKELREKEDLKRAIDKRTAKGLPFARIDSIEFRRVILVIKGELVNMPRDKRLGARFVSRDRTRMFYPAHFDTDGDRFELSINIMCSRGEAPITS